MLAADRAVRMTTKKTIGRGCVFGVCMHRAYFFIVAMGCAHLFVNMAQEQESLLFAISAMPSAHDASSLNEIASNSAIASRALVCEKLGRNDVDISCVHPPLFRRCIWQIFFLLL